MIVRVIMQIRQSPTKHFMCSIDLATTPFDNTKKCLCSVNPVWNGGYDPTFCAKMKSGWVYCGCSDDQLPGMKEGINTCIDKGIVS